MTHLSDFVVFDDQRTASRYGGPGRAPMGSVLEAYLDGALDIPDIDAFLDRRHELVTFDLTAEHVRFFLTRMIPEWLVHSRAQDTRIVRDHYDRGDDFFHAFLGDSMIYTAGYFREPTDSLEEAQRNKMNRVTEKLGIEAGHRVLDIGCGWGTLVAHIAKSAGASTTGITLAERGAAFGNERIASEGVADRARVRCLDYRELPHETYDRIVSLEMVEHVGIKNLSKYFGIVRDRLADDGLFLVQWCGLRRGGREGVPPVGMRPEDMIWGLFMNKYIFAGADASIPLSEMCKVMEKQGFEVHSMENVSTHYVHTLRHWLANWRANRDTVLKSYGERWYRLWNLFLAWSWRIGAQGTSVCYQVVAHKNLDRFDRDGLARANVA